VEPALVLRYGRFAKSCSPDEAKRNPGKRYRFDHAPRVSLRSTRATKERTKEKYRRRNADRRKASSAVPYGHGRTSNVRRTSIGVPPRSRPKESFIARDSAPDFYFLGLGGQGEPVRRAGVTRPYLSQSSDQTRPGHSARGFLPGCRPGAGCKSARGHRPRPTRSGYACRTAPIDWARYGAYVTKPVTIVNATGTRNFVIRRCKRRAFPLPLAGRGRGGGREAKRQR
jgi:hypothetical protein